jgi:hypothetical protein
MIALNNPAVCGAVSWRLAEYLNQGCLSCHFHLKLSYQLILLRTSGLYSITATKQYKDVIDYLFEILTLMKPLLQEKLF